MGILAKPVVIMSTSPSQYALIASQWPELHEEAQKVEQFAFSDPRTACFYARRTIELLVEWVYDNDSQLERPYGAQTLADLIYAFGEERLSRRIARRIKLQLAEQGPFSGTAALAYCVAGCYPPQARRGRIHPATRTFQALRIAVNDELGVLDRLLAAAPDWLLPGGLFGVISFHSLEDRRVKTAFVGDERLQRVTRKPETAAEEEQSSNPRSRSAKWRLARRRQP